MIRTVKGELVCECNECGREFAGGTQENFRDFIAELKQAGWEIQKDEDEWIHCCPRCR